MQIVKYMVVYYDIQQKILSGSWYSGMLISPESTLCDLYKVSRVTLRKAMDQLQRDGLILKIQGKGTFVSKQKIKNNSSENHLGFRDNLIKSGLTIESQIIDSGIVIANNTIIEKLKLPLNKEHKLWYFTRLREISNHPVVIAKTYVPFKIGEKMNKIDLKDQSFFRLYSEITGQRVGDTEGTITSIIPTNEECELLKEPIGSPHLYYEGVTFLENHNPIEYTNTIYNSHYYKFSVDMTNLLPINCLIN